MKTILRKIVYTLSFVAAIASAYLTFSTWFADRNAHSLRVRIVSQIALQPFAAGSISKLQLTFNGDPLMSPYLSVLELSNNGTKPILRNDYEKPIEIVISNDAIVKFVEVSGAKSRSLEPKYKLTENVVQIEPLLLNPDDVVAISILTSGVVPKFTTKGRVANIAALSIDEASIQNNGISGYAVVFRLIAAFLLAVVAIANIDNLFRKNNAFILRQRMSWFIVVVTVLVGEAILITAFDIGEFTSMTQLGIIFSIAVLAVSLSASLNRKPTST